MINFPFLTIISYFFFYFFSSFSVWKVGGEEYATDANKELKPKIKDLECKIWSKSDNTKESCNPPKWSCAASWYDKNTVIMNDSTGAVGLFVQGFDYNRDQ
jgi:hypothetical protein